MLKQWMLNPDLHAIEVEEKYTAWCQQLRTDKYTTAGQGHETKFRMPGDGVPARKAVRAIP